MAILLKKEVLQKSAGKEGEKFEGPARVFDGEQELIAWNTNRKSKSR